MPSSWPGEGNEAARLHPSRPLPRQCWQRRSRPHLERPVQRQVLASGSLGHLPIEARSRPGQPNSLIRAVLGELQQPSDLIPLPSRRSEEPDHWLCWLLPACRKRPRNRAGKKRNELAPSHCRPHGSRQSTVTAQTSTLLRMEREVSPCPLWVISRHRGFNF
jgi:hypothetical protein